MKISDFLSPADVALDVRARDKSRLLRQLSAQAATELGLSVEEVSSAIIKREGLGSTVVGNGVALPHARLEDIEAPFGLFAAARPGTARRDGAGPTSSARERTLRLVGAPPAPNRAACLATAVTASCSVFA